MLFGGKRRVEEDLERIRLANLPEGREAEKAAKECREAEAAAKAFKKSEKPAAKDLFAIVLAVLSLVLPYFLVLCAVLAVVFFLLSRAFWG